jgi:uncharacterized protein (DUF58 family)
VITSLRTLPPEVLEKIERLKLEARRNAEGLYTGLHRSPRHGVSIEFSEHKEYVAGDDIRRMDWRVFAKSDRYYIKRYEQETNLKGILLLDASASMAYGSHALTKLDFAAQMIMAFSYILLNQSDSAGLFICSEAQRKYVPASSQKTHVNEIAEALIAVEGRGETRIGEWLESTQETAGKASFVMVFSDFFFDEEKTMRALKSMNAHQQEILVFHVLDPFELKFPFSLRTRFLDMETPRDLTLEPLAVKAGYLDMMNAFTANMKLKCRENGIGYQLCDTSVPISAHLYDFFAGRGD